MAKTTKKSSKTIALEPRPTYKPAQGKLNDLIKSLAAVLKAGEDQDGKLSPEQRAQGMAAMTVLNSARALLKCPQLFGAYDPTPKLKSKSKSTGK